MRSHPNLSPTMFGEKNCRTAERGKRHMHNPARPSPPNTTPNNYPRNLSPHPLHRGTHPPQERAGPIPILRVNLVSPGILFTTPDPQRTIATQK